MTKIPSIMLHKAQGWGKFKWVNLQEIMKRAYLNHLLIPAFNVPYLPMVKPIVDTLKGLNSFGLVQAARPDIEKFEARSFAAVAEEFNKYADRRYCRLHQDHIPVIDEDGQRVDWEDLIKQALALHYDSVMIDGSRLSLKENIRVTKTVVEMGHRQNVPVEAELGAVMGHENIPLPPYEELFCSGKGFTEPRAAERFVKETSVDWLSVAIGNIHGAISGIAKDQKKIEAKLNIGHLQKISERVKIPLVLHGGSGIKLEYLFAAIKNGIAKINVGTVIRQAYEKKLKEKKDLRYAQEAVTKAVTKIINDYQISDSIKVLKGGKMVAAPFRVRRRRLKPVIENAG